MQAASGDAMSGVPSSRWVLEAMIDRSSLTSVQQACVQHGGFVTYASGFDAIAFGNHKVPAAGVRLMVHIAWQFIRMDYIVHGA